MIGRLNLLILRGITKLTPKSPDCQLHISSLQIEFPFVVPIAALSYPRTHSSFCFFCQSKLNSETREL